MLVGITNRERLPGQPEIGGRKGHRKRHMKRHMKRHRRKHRGFITKDDVMRANG